MIFYKTSPLLVFPLSYFLHRIFIDRRKRRQLFQVIITILIATSLFLSGTRANILSMLFIISFYLLNFIYQKSKYVFTFLILMIVFIILLKLPSTIQIIFDANEESNQIKFAHATSYIEVFNNWNILLFGQGLGSSFYSFAYNKEILNSELTYLELIRIWGLFLSFLFFIFLMIPLIAEISAKKFSFIFVAYISYLFICGTNPLLLSSTGMISLVFVFNFVLQNYRIKLLNGNRYSFINF
jgi:hypothetical protein